LTNAAAGNKISEFHGWQRWLQLDFHGFGRYT
jgi:hypothetical protein